jgi:hypothetical protein
LIPYSVVMALLFVVFQRARVIVPVLLTAMVAMGVWFYSYRGVGTDVEVEKFYSTTLGETAERMESHGIDAVVGTIKQAGFWGYGLGMATQGSHNIRCKRPNVWQESGLSMLAAEMGVPGLVLFAGVTGVLLLSLWWSLQVSGMSPLYVIYFGLVGVIVANGMAGIVSAQVFGDPFIGWFMSFLVGVVLSGARLEPVK